MGEELRFPNKTDLLYRGNKTWESTNVAGSTQDLDAVHEN